MSLPTEVVKCKAPICQQVNEAYLKAPTELKLFLIDATKRLRTDLEMSAEELSSRLGIARSSLFNYMNRLGLKYKDIVEALKKEAEETLARKLEKREIRRALPTTKQEFLERSIVQQLRNAMISAGKKPYYVNRIISFFYRVCKATGLSPEDFIELHREGRSEELYNAITMFISDQASMGIDVNNIVRQLQTIQKWLGVRVLPPGVTQKEYKGKYQEAEIPLSIREEIVRELLELYKQTGDTTYVRTIQAMIILYYTGSRRQALTNYVISDVVTVTHEKFIRAMRTNRFRIISTLEKKDLRWNKLIPIYYDEAIPRANFSYAELKQIAKILKEQLQKRIDRLNTHTRLYLEKSKVFHIWRHTATREYLRVLEYNRSLVAKLLGWIKDSNLVIYGDYSILQLLGAEGGVEQQTYLDFVSPELREEILKVIRSM
ncbi:MAG: hypothetical protein QXM79_07250 [Zestosphaera sp.]